MADGISKVQTGKRNANSYETVERIEHQAVGNTRAKSVDFPRFTEDDVLYSVVDKTRRWKQTTEEWEETEPVTITTRVEPSTAIYWVAEPVKGSAEGELSAAIYEVAEPVTGTAEEEPSVAIYEIAEAVKETIEGEYEERDAATDRGRCECELSEWMDRGNIDYEDRTLIENAIYE